MTPKLLLLKLQDIFDMLKKHGIEMRVHEAGEGSGFRDAGHAILLNTAQRVSFKTKGWSESIELDRLRPAKTDAECLAEGMKRVVSAMPTVEEVARHFSLTVDQLANRMPCFNGEVREAIFNRILEINTAYAKIRGCSLCQARLNVGGCKTPQEAEELAIKHNAAERDAMVSTQELIARKVYELVTLARDNGVRVAVQRTQNQPPLIDLLKSAYVHISGPGWSESIKLNEEKPAGTRATVVVSATLLARNGQPDAPPKAAFRDESEAYRPKVVHEYDGEQHRIVIVNYNGTSSASPWTFCHEEAVLDNYRARRHGTKWDKRDLLYEKVESTRVG